MTAHINISKESAGQNNLLLQTAKKNSLKKAQKIDVLKAQQAKWFKVTKRASKNEKLNYSHK